MDFALVAVNNAISNLDEDLYPLVSSCKISVAHFPCMDFEGESEYLPGVIIIPTDFTINFRLTKSLEKLTRCFYRAMGRSLVLIVQSSSEAELIIKTPFGSIRRIQMESGQLYALANNQFGSLAMPGEFVVDCYDLKGLWKLVVASLYPLTTKVLVSQNCHLISFDRGVAVVGVTSPQLFKLHRERIQKLSAAFEIVCKRKVEVKLQVMTNDQ